MCINIQPYIHSTLSLPDALPICRRRRLPHPAERRAGDMKHPLHPALVHFPIACWTLATLADIGSRWWGEPAWRSAGGLLLIGARSEEHTSELQSRENLVCRRLLA